MTPVRLCFDFVPPYSDRVRGRALRPRHARTAICADVGMPERALDDAESAEGKQRLRRQTDEALASRALGDAA
jgi:hypothetical protein